jgi:sulfate adenylyltransferase (ADP) / ATP adenylyltransferase
MAFKPQTHLLEQSDLEATWACLQAYAAPSSTTQESGRGGLYAFFNSGPHSGASQPHRHIQLLPVERMRDGMKAGEDWDVLADSLVGDDSVAAKVPFKTFGQRLNRDVSGEELHQTYLRLYREAVKAVDAAAKGLAQHDKPSEAEEIKQGRSKDDDEQESAHGVRKSQTGVGEEATISYNMALTLDAIVILPRVAEGSAVYDAEGKAVGQLQLNGTVLAGTALVKNESEWNALRNDEGQLVHVLGKIGVRQV